MEELERVQARLDNISTVEPILGALRTISLGSWQAAQKQQAAVQGYAGRLLALLPSLLPHLPDRWGKAGRRSAAMQRYAGRLLARAPALWRYVPARWLVTAPAAPARLAVLVVGSERGLCGRFNAAIAEFAGQYLDKQARAGVQFELLALGSRVCRLLESQERPLVWSGQLSATTLPSSRLAFDLTRRWLPRYEAQELDAVDLLYNTYQGAGRYEPTAVRLIPPTLPQRGTAPSGVTGRGGESPGEPWPPPIVETDPLSLWTRIIEQWAVTNLYGRLLESAAAEHSARYQLMEAAAQNTGRLIEELTLEVQTARRHAITQEMQELAAGAGLVGS